LLLPTEESRARCVYLCGVLQDDLVKCFVAQEVVAPNSPLHLVAEEVVVFGSTMHHCVSLWHGVCVCAAVRSTGTRCRGAAGGGFTQFNSRQLGSFDDINASFRS
jgi:hypothetical protein